MALFRCGAGDSKTLKEVISLGNIVGSGNYANFSCDTAIVCTTQSAAASIVSSKSNYIQSITAYAVTFKAPCHGVIIKQPAGGSVTITEKDFVASDVETLAPSGQQSQSGTIYIYD